MMKMKRIESGFTLLELIIIIAILAILSAVIIPVVSGYIEKANVAADTANLRMLNSVSQVFRLESDPITEDLFSGITTDAARMNTLVSYGYLNAILTPKQEDRYFAWMSDTQQWMLVSQKTPTTLTGVTMATGGHIGYIKGSYSGSEMDMVVPLKLDGVDITHVYQDVFNGKGLTSVEFDPDTKITEIHARAFNNNNLTEVVIPDSVQKLDYAAFNNNPITKITIGSDVIFESNVFRNNNAFRDTYLAQGAGTYVFVDGVWVKQ
jgi:type II secretory pathway pseudopilin PulG